MFKRAGKIEDLDSAIKSVRKAMRLSPPCGIDREEFVLNLSVLLSSQYEFTGQLNDLDSSVEAAREALLLRSVKDDQYANIVRQSRSLPGTAV